MEVAEIAQWVGVDRDTVWSVVRNEDGDDLAEDQIYLDGKRGHIINVDALKNIRPFVKGEPMDDDQWLRYGSSVSDDEYDSEEEIEMEYIRSSPVAAPRRHRRDEDAPGDPEHMFEEVEESSPGPEPSPSSASPPASSTVYSNTVPHSPLTTRTKMDGAIATFVRGLGGGPSDQLLEVFCDMEIDSAERLDWLCQQEGDYWEDVKDYMLQKGVKLFHWLVVKKGLRERAAALAASSELKT
ncbi:hypothetical protein PsYK624_055850 [Phanerochaete sordida]|uniref:Uncharacterized protein n=1 Tax=Phanerochaete sordida TaxID=48140 RepID=A0A9P3LCE1_9APHY|nr:hypothetical protein PsYK624_055850 [Phanerochaete sordida]